MKRFFPMALLVLGGTLTACSNAENGEDEGGPGETRTGDAEVLDLKAGELHDAADLAAELFDRFCPPELDSTMVQEADAPGPDEVQVPDTLPEQDLSIPADSLVQSDSPVLPDSPAPLDAQAPLDLSDGWPEEAEPQAPDGQEVVPQPGPQLYTDGDGCAQPVAYQFPGCQGVACPAGKECMGEGVCVPSSPFMLAGTAWQSQVKPALAANPDGSFAMAWYEVPSGSLWMDIGFRLFNADGSPKTESVKVDQDELEWARSPSLAALSNGKYIVFWRSQTGIGGGVAYHARVVSADGLPEGNSIAVNSTQLESELGSIGNVDCPFAEPLRDQSIGVAWSGEPKGDTHNVNVYFRVFDASGLPQAGEMDCGGATELDEGSAAVAPLPGSGMTVFWQSGTLWQDYAIMGVRLNSGGLVLQEAGAVSPGEDKYEGLPAATTFGDKAMLLTWKTRDDSMVTGPSGIRCALLDVATLASLGEWDVGFDPEGVYPFYAPVRAGTWDRGLIAWHTCSETGGMYVRRFYLDQQWLDCEATEIGGPLLPGETPCRTMPAIAAFDDGRFLVAWNTDLKDNNGASRTRVMMRFLR
jgi:hypothetical protein